MTTSYSNRMSSLKFHFDFIILLLSVEIEVVDHVLCSSSIEVNSPKKIQTNGSMNIDT